MVEQKRYNWLIKRYNWLIAGISLWVGIGLMSILNIIKTVYTQNVLPYDWIMLAFSIIFIIIGLILIIIKKYR